MTEYDFRDQEPVWVQYAEWISTKHDKFYEVRIDFTDAGLFVMTRRWGRRPDTGAGQIMTETFQSLGNAQTHARNHMRGKMQKGYSMVDRPLAASGKVARDNDIEDY